MKKLYSLFTFVLFLILGMLALSFTASAYIDPSAMTYIVQVVVGIVIVGGASLGFYFSKLKRKLSRKKSDEPAVNAPSANDEVIEDNGEFDDLDSGAEE